MKKAAVPTTAARGTAVSRSRITAVQSVYIAADEYRPHHLRWGPAAAIPVAAIRLAAIRLAAMTAALVLAGGFGALPLRADVRFENCQPTADGGETCDTSPTGNTRLDDLDARFGLFDEASPGWNEFEPFEGDDAMFGDNGT